MWSLKAKGPGTREESAREMDRAAFTDRVFQQRDIEDSGMVTSGDVKTRSKRVSKPVIGSRLYIY